MDYIQCVDLNIHVVIIKFIARVNVLAFKSFRPVNVGNRIFYCRNKCREKFVSITVEYTN